MADNLHLLLVELFDKEAMRTLLRQSQIPEGEVDFSGALIDIWNDALWVANNRRKLESLVEQACERIPERADDLQQALAAYLSGEDGTPPSSPDNPPGRKGIPQSVLIALIGLAGVILAAILPPLIGPLLEPASGPTQTIAQPSVTTDIPTIPPTPVITDTPIVTPTPVAADTPTAVPIPKKPAAWLDFNGDGITDVFRATANGWQISYGGTTEWRLYAELSVAISELAFGDFDGDNKTDVFRATGDQWEVVYGGEDDKHFRHLKTSAIRLPDLALGDFDGDGKTDVFRATGSRWQVSFGGKTDWQPYAPHIDDLSDLAFGDFDGDGKTDVFRATGTSWEVFYSRETSAGWKYLNLSNLRVSDLAFKDFGDTFSGPGKTDVFRVTGVLGSKEEATKRRWEVSYGGITEWKTRAHADTVSISGLAFGDFNGDGKTDVFASTGSKWLVSYSGDDDRSWKSINESMTDMLDNIALRDANNDGKID